MIDATRSGRCGGCDEAIEEGDAIGVVDGEWVCAECVNDAGGEDRERARHG